MKFTCEKAVLLSGVLTAMRAVSPKSTLSVLEGLLLEAGDELLITGFNLKTGIRTRISADIIEQGSIVINAKLFGEIIRKMSDDVITIRTDNGSMVKLDCALSSFEIMGISAEDFPELPSVDLQNSISVPENKLKAMIAETIFAVSDNEAKPVHTGSLFDVENDFLTVVSVDGYRLALRREALEGEKVENTSFIVPGAALSEVEKIASTNEEMVKITLGTRHIMFNIGNTELISRRLEGEFLNYKNSIPSVNKYSLEANKRNLIESVERVSLIINDRMKSPIRCLFAQDTVKISTLTTLGRANDECTIKGDGENLEIGFNNKYLLDALKAAPADEIRIMLNSAVSPCTIVPEDGNESFLYMILPVRIRSDEAY